VKLALVQSSRRKPDAHAILYQDFNPVGAAVDEEISAVWLRCTEYRDHPGQRGLGTGTHVHRFGGEPDGVDADHLASSRTKRAHPSGSEVGHFTVIDCSLMDSSTIANTSADRLGEALKDGNAGNGRTELQAFLNNLGFERFGVRASLAHGNPVVKGYRVRLKIRGHHRP
jgi:hypothetical protein